MQKLKLLRMFAKNPTLKDTSTVLAPKEEATLLAQVQAQQREQGLQHRVRIGSQELSEMPIMQKY